MKTHPYFLTAAVCLLICSLFLVSFVTATATPTPTGKHMPCLHPGYPTVDPDLVSRESTQWGMINYEFFASYDGPPYTISFTDNSVAPEGQTISSRYWNLGDGTTSTEKNLVHVYAAPGSYSALLSVTPSCGSDYNKKVAFTVKIFCTDPTPGFRSDVYQGTAPLTVHITDTSTHAPLSITTWTYRFDSAHTSNNRNPSFTYMEPGTYTIIQNISKTCLSRDPSATKNLGYSAQVTVYPKVVASTFDNSTYDTYTFDNYTWVDVTTTTVSAPAVTTTTAATTTATAVPTTVAGAFVQSTTAQNTPAGSAQQTEPPAPGTGTLSVTTNPAGAAVFVDDVPWGASPATIPNLAAGAHNLRLEKAGYQNLSVPVAITDGKTAEYSLALVPVSGGMGMLPLIAGAFIVIALAGIGGFLYMQKKKALPPAEPPK